MLQEVGVESYGILNSQSSSLARLSSRPLRSLGAFAKKEETAPFKPWQQRETLAQPSQCRAWRTSDCAGTWGLGKDAWSAFYVSRAIPPASTEQSAIPLGQASDPSPRKTSSVCVESSQPPLRGCSDCDSLQNLLVFHSSPLGAPILLIPCYFRPTNSSSHAASHDRHLSPPSTTALVRSHVGRATLLPGYSLTPLRLGYLFVLGRLMPFR